jgi:hypothetical protein
MPIKFFYNHAIVVIESLLSTVANNNIRLLNVFKIKINISSEFRLQVILRVLDFFCQSWARSLQSVVGAM